MVALSVLQEAAGLQSQQSVTQQVENGANPQVLSDHNDLKLALCETFKIAADRAEWVLARWLVSYVKEVNS